MTARKHTRKRSHHAMLVLMVPATGMLMSACSPEPETQTPAVVYSSVQECQQQHPDASAQCEADYKQAVALHPQVAPKYQTLQECEADFGARRCEIAPEQQYRSSGGGFFMPMMMGYMASQMFSRSSLGQAAPYATNGSPRDNVRRDDDDQRSGFAVGGSGARGSVPVQPLYKSRDDSTTFRTADNSPVANRTGAVNVGSQALTTRVGGARRIGGFGATAASFESAGG